MFGTHMGKLLPLVLLALAAIMTWWIESMVSTSAPTVKKSIRHDPDYIMENLVSTSLDQSGNLDYTMSAVKLAHYPDDDSTVIDKPFIKVYKDAQEVWHVESAKGIASSEGKEVYLEGRVDIQRLPTELEEAATINTSNVLVKTEENLALTDDRITIKDKNGTTTAMGMRLNFKDKKLELLSEVKGSYESK